MRLFEVEDRFANDFAMVLRNLRGRGDSQHAPQRLTYPAVNNLLKNLGYGEVNPAVLADLVKQYPSLNDEIKSFDDDEIVLKSEEDQEADATDVPPGPSVDQMAHAGAQDYQSDLG